MCEFFDLRVSRSCREPVADDVRDKERANFCGYYQPRPGAYQAPDGTAARRSRAALDALFNQSSTDRAAAEAGNEDSQSATARAREQLDQLFKK
jgi:hypothetical protein